MRSLKLWSVALALAWFIAGFSAGLVVSSKEKDESPTARYARALSAEFGLNGLRRRTLIQVLDDYQSKRTRIRRRFEAASREDMEPDLEELDRVTQDRIRNTILPPAQRGRYDARNRPLLVSAQR